jgi:transcriptional regulator with XRE-family HTH domain
LGVRNDFAVRLRSVRLSCGVSQAVLGEALGVGQAYIAKWEAAAYRPSDDVLKRVAGFFRVSERWLAHGMGCVYSGVIFLPLRMYLTKRGFNRKALLRTARFVMDDGGRALVLAVSQGDRSNGVFLFSRTDEFFLFLPFRSSEMGRGQHGVVEEMWAALKESRDQEPADGVVAGAGGDPTVRVCVLSEADFRLLVPSTPLSVLEGILSFSIPDRLKAAHSTGTGQGTEESRVLLKLFHMNADDTSGDSSIDGFLADFMKRMEDERTLRTLLAVSPLLRAKLGVDDEGVARLPFTELKERITRMAGTQQSGVRRTDRAHSRDISSGDGGAQR